MKRLLIVCLCLVAAPYLADLFAYRGQSSTTWPTGTSRSVSDAVCYRDGRVKRDGRHVAYYRNGQQAEQGEFRDGQRHGAWQSWYESGELQTVGEYEDGSGILITYYRQGGKLSEGPYQDSVPHGHWREWDRDGNLIKEGEYVAGALNGRWRYHEPGAEPPYREIVWEHGIAVIDGEEVRSAGAPAVRQRPGLFRFLGHCLLFLLLCVGPLPLVWWLYGSDRRFAATPATSDGLLGLLAGWICLQGVVGLLLGAVGWYHLTGLVGAELLLFAGGGWLLGRHPHNRNQQDIRNNRVFRPQNLWPSGGWTVSEAALLLCFLLVGFALFWRNLAVPMSDWDSQAYHLPVIARWYQAGGFIPLPELGQVGRYPFNLEAVTGLLVLPFGEDLLVGLPPTLAWVLMALAQYGLVRRLIPSRPEALFSVLLLAVAPLILLQAEELRADLAVLAFFLAALYLGGLFHPAGGRRPLLWLLCLGYLAGLKGSAPLYAAVAVGAVVFWRGTRSRAESGSTSTHSRPGVGPLVVITLTACFLGGFWYLRNLVELGNPLGHVQIGRGDWLLWPGVITAAELTRSTLASIFEPTRDDHWRLLGLVAWQRFGLPILLLCVLALLGLVKGLAPGNRAVSHRRPLLLLLLLTVCAGLIYWFTPYGGDNGDNNYQLTTWIGLNMRFGFIFVALVGLLAALGWRIVRLPHPILAGAGLLLAGWSVAVEVAPDRTALWIWAGFAWGLAAVSLRSGLGSGTVSSAGGAENHFRGTTRRRLIFRPVVLILGICLVCWGLYSGRNIRETRRPASLGGTYRLATQADPEAVLGYAMLRLTYPLYGPELRQPVVSAVCLGKSYAAWRQEIVASDIELLFVGARPTLTILGVEETDIRPWLERPDSPFELRDGAAAGAEGVDVYQRRVGR
ncbi:MAG: glycosyltransferase family 39 protein [bacterium]